MKSFDKQIVFYSGLEGYAFFRIPVLTVSSDNRLLAFCEGRRHSRSDSGSIDIVLRSSSDGGKSWSPLCVVVKGGDNTCGNPCPLIDPQSGRICLVFTSNRGIDRERDIMAGKAPPRRVHRTFSADGGVSWSEPEDINASARRENWTWYATGPCHGLRLAGGRYIVPCNHGILGEEKTRSHIIYSDDGGEHWLIGAECVPGTNEASAAETSRGLYLNMRNTFRQHKRAAAFSRDGGETLEECFLVPDLPDPYCQGSVLSAGEHLFFTNAASKTRRKNLTLRSSADGGLTWNRGFQVCGQMSAYSDIAVSGGNIYVLYEGQTREKYDTIRLASISINDYFKRVSQKTE